jgi:hypothetical protein
VVSRCFIIFGRRSTTGYPEASTVEWLRRRAFTYGRGTVHPMMLKFSLLSHFIYGMLDEDKSL